VSGVKTSSSAAEQIRTRLMAIAGAMAGYRWREGEQVDRIVVGYRGTPLPRASWIAR
jgi:hypothetical protein